MTIGSMIGLVFLVLLLFLSIKIGKHLDNITNNLIFVYPKTGNKYKVISRGKMKDKYTGKWYYCVTYRSITDGNYYTREEVDFYNKFVNIKDYESRERNG